MFDFISPSPEASARKWVSRVTLSCRRRSLAESQSWTLTSKCQTCWARCTRHICDDMITELVEAWYKNTAEGLDEASQSISFYFVVSKIHGRPIVRPASIPPTFIIESKHQFVRSESKIMKKNILPILPNCNIVSVKVPPCVYFFYTRARARTHTSQGRVT